MAEEFRYEESSVFVLHDGRYFLDETQSRVFSTIVSARPHCSSEYKWDELSLGELFARCYKPTCRYCPEAREWFVYDSTKWVRDVGSVIVSGKLKEFTKLMQLYCNEIPENEDGDADIIKKYKTFVAKMGDRRVRDRILRDAQDEAAIPIATFDSNPYLINCENGTYDLSEGEFKEHNPEDYLTMITNCYYPLPSQNLKFPRWGEFIDEITCGEKDIARYLQRALGYSLCGIAKEECMFIAYGKTTRNGKGTLFNTIHTILGDYAKAMQVDFICTGRGGRGSYDRANPMLASLKGKRFVTLSESEDAGKLDEAQIKNYTGNDPITTRNLHEKAFTFTPQFKMWLSCNSLPAVYDKSLFSSDRVRVIEFNKHFSENERDVELKSKFLQEDAKAVIFKWLTDGYVNYCLKGLAEPQSIKDSIKSYEKKNDKVGLFVEERCDISEDARVGRGEFYTAYKSWCRSNGLTAMSSPKFNEAMEKYAKPVALHGVKQWKGITLNTNGGITIK